MWNIIIIILINVWCISIISISISIIIYYLIFIICRLQQRGFWIFFFVSILVQRQAIHW